MVGNQEVAQKHMIVHRLIRRLHPQHNIVIMSHNVRLTHGRVVVGDYVLLLAYKQEIVIKLMIVLPRKPLLQQHLNIAKLQIDRNIKLRRMIQKSLTNPQL